MATIKKGKIGVQDHQMWDGKSTKTFTRQASDGTDITLRRIDWPGVDILEVYGDGTNYTGGTIQSAIDNIGSASATLYFAPGTWTLSANITIPSNISIYMPKGAYIDLNSKTLTVNGAIIAGPYQIVSGTFTQSTNGYRLGLWHGGSDYMSVTNLTATNLTIGARAVSANGALLIEDSTFSDMRTTLGLGTSATLDVGTSANNIVQLDSNAKLPAVDGSQLTNMSELQATLPFNYLSGFNMSNGTDSDHDIDIATGECKDSTNTISMALSSEITKQIDATWDEGSSAGGLDSGSVANSTWYHVFIIKNNTSGTVDALFSTSVDSPSLPSGYSYFRRIGSVKTDGSANIIAFYQYGDKFFWNDPPLDVNVSNQGTTATDYTLSVPTGVVVETNANVSYYNATVTSANYMYIKQTGSNISDEAPSASAAPLASHWVAPAAVGMASFRELRVLTDTSAQISIRCSQASSVVKIATLGWIDLRGKL